MAAGYALGLAISVILALTSTWLFEGPERGFMIGLNAALALLWAGLIGYELLAATPAH